MPRYDHPDVSFEVPRDWEDKSVAAFTAPIAAGQKFAPNVVLTRDKLEPGENLAGYADRQLVELAKRLDKFSLVKRSEITVSDQPAIEFRFTWKGGAGLVDQRLIMCATGKRLVLSFTSTIPKGTGQNTEAIVDRILATMRIPGTAPNGDAS